MEEFFIFLLKSAGLLTAFLVFYFLLLKKDTSFVTNRRFLLGGLITSAILPAVYFTKTVFVKAQPGQFQWTENTFPVAEIAIQEPTLSALEIIAGIYILGVIVMILRLLVQLLSLSRVLLSGKFTRQENANFIETASSIAPFSFLNYIVYNPTLHTDVELQYILKHEKAHVQQVHTLDVLLANINLIYQWFNPFAWLYLKNIQQNLEFIADREAVKKATCKKEYQKALVKISVENFNLALTNNFYQSLIKKRIVMLNKPSSNNSASWKTVLIVPALLAFILLFNIKTVAQVVVEEEKEVSPYEVSTNIEISFQVEKITKTEQLEAYIKMLEKYKVQLEFENVTRNDAGLLTGITAKFLDKNNNSTGSISRQSDDGIKGFAVYYSEKDGAGFRTLTNTQGQEAHTIARNLGVAPLIIIEGKQYNISQLEGKSIKVMGDVGSINSINAVKTYGNLAKEGALIISKGEIIEDLDAEFREIDKKSDNVVRDYIKFQKGEKPMFISVNSNLAETFGNSTTTFSAGNNKEEMRLVTGSNSAGTVRNLTIPGKAPIYIVNGKVLGKNVLIDTVNQANITGVNVLQGYSATAVYGKEAKDGAIVITTRKAGDTIGYRLSGVTMVPTNSTNTKKITFNPARSGTLDSLKLNRIYTVNRVEFIEDGNTGRTRTFNSGGEIFYPQVTGNESRGSFFRIDGKSDYSDKPLIIVDGKEMPANFEMSSINNDRIEILTVIKGAEAIEKYGEDAKGGAVEVTTSIRANTATVTQGNFEIVKASSTDKELNQAITRIKKKTGIDVEFKNVKRNRDGVIRSIHVLARHQGENVTLTVSESGGINDIYIGKVKNKIRVTTNP